jgi:DNA repair exonuclease SbcCD nuclease subunit
VPAFTWPESVCIFPAERVETVDVSIGSRPVASVSGISYGRRAEGRDLAALFPRPGESPFSIAVLHANAGSQPGHAPYAPCTVESLRSAGYDYWALGHVHGHAVLCRDPMIVYPGCTQGLSVRESGPKGCVVVDVGDGGAVQTEFVSLAPVRWETVSVACQAAETVDAFEERALAQIEDACTGAAGCDVLIVRLSVTASGSVYDLLADDDDAAADLLDHLRDQLGARTSPRCWLKDMRVESRLTPLGVAEGMQRQDFLGEVFRVSAELAEKESDVRVELLARLNELFGSRHARHALKSLSDDEITQILAEARLVCTQLLGN